LYIDQWRNLDLLGKYIIRVTGNQLKIKPDLATKHEVTLADGKKKHDDKVPVFGYDVWIRRQQVKVSFFLPYMAAMAIVFIAPTAAVLTYAGLPSSHMLTTPLHRELWWAGLGLTTAVFLYVGIYLVAATRGDDPRGPAPDPGPTTTDTTAKPPPSEDAPPQR
jgi:hypothetical protein